MGQALRIGVHSSFVPDGTRGVNGDRRNPTLKHWAIFREFWQLSRIRVLSAKPNAKAFGYFQGILATEQGSCALSDVLDPFCGCGMAIDAAVKLGRQWIGIDITPLATTLIKGLLRDTFGTQLEIIIVGERVTYQDAVALASKEGHNDKFQWWALGLVGARPVEQKSRAERDRKRRRRTRRRATWGFRFKFEVQHFNQLRHSILHNKGIFDLMQGPYFQGLGSCVGSEMPGSKRFT